MFPRNAATPPVIDLGQILQISDGAIQTTGASVRVRIGTGAWGAGAGTLACDTTSGIWTYAPTQAETNADYFIVGAYKSGCTALSKTVITSDSATSGRVYVATNGDKTGYSLTQTFPSNFSSLAITAGGAVTVGTNNDKTGYSLTQSFPANFSSLAITVGGAVTVGTNNDKTGYALTQSFPSNFAALGINASGHVSRVTLVDTTTNNTDMRGTDNAALASNWTATRAGYLDGVLIAANYNQRTVQVTGSNHVAADVHEFQPGVITSGDFAAGAITSTVLATDSITSSQIAASAVTEIQSGLASQSSVNTLTTYVDTEVAAIKAKTDQLSFTVANQVDANALTGGGGSSSIVVTPVVAQTPVRAVATTITTYKGDRSAITVGVFSGTTPVNLSTLGALEICIQTKAGTDLQLISAANITISGTSSNYFSFSPNSTAVGTVGRFMWSLRVASSSSKQVVVYGAFVVEDAALAD